MTRWATLAIALLFSAIAIVHTTGTASGQGGWIALFDGKNLDHWEGDGTATVQDRGRFGYRHRQEGP
jgi:Spy/CpxP family protein refolding chaperone